MKKFWKNASLRLKLGLIITIFFLILGFVVYFFPHADPFPNNIRMKNKPRRWSTGWAPPPRARTSSGC